MKNNQEDILRKVIVQNDIEQFKSLLESGSIDFAAKNKFGNAPLHMACKNEKLQIVELMLHNKCDIDVNIKGIEGNTPLHYAVNRENHELAKLLIDYGADVNSTDREGNTPLFNSVLRFQGNIKIIKTLLNNGADPTIKNRHGILLEKFLSMPKNKTIKHLFKQDLE